MDGNRTKLTDVNPHLVCVLCHGYFVDATTIAECLHSFCRSCIFRHLEKKSICPICEVQVHTTKLHLSLRLDKTLQDIVYKLVPGLFRNEMQRRRDFYQNHPYRDEHLDPESRGVGLDRLIYSPDDLISLSLEFYNDELDKEVWSNNNNSPKQKPEKETAPGTKRFLQCPAAFKMAHLKKFIRQKYGLPPNCNVEILYRRESLPDSYSLMDIAYIYTWKRNGPMRFYYRMPDYLQKAASMPTLDVEESKAEEKTEEAKEEIKVEEVPSVRQMSKQDELSVSVLLSLGDVVEKDHEFLLPKPFSYPKAPNTPRPGTEHYKKKILNGKLNPKFSVNKIASALAKNNMKKLPWKKEENDPFAFSDAKMSTVQYKPLQKDAKNELTVPPLKISFKGTPRVDPSSLPPPKAPTSKARVDAAKAVPSVAKGSTQGLPSTVPSVTKGTTEASLSTVPSVNNGTTPAIPKAAPSTVPSVTNGTTPSAVPKASPSIVPSVTNGTAACAIPKAAPSTVPNGTAPSAIPKASPSTVPSVTKGTTPPIPKSSPSPVPTAKSPSPPLKPKSPQKSMPALISSPLPLMPKVPLWPATPKNGHKPPEVTVKTTNGSLTITTQPPEPMTHKLPCIPRPPIRKLKPLVPGGVISKTGPTLDQRIQQLYKAKNAVQVPTESRLANWLNNRFQKEKPKTPEKETDVAKVSKEMCILKRKLDELRKAQNACEITQENPIPKTRDITPNVSIEFLRGADIKSKEKTKRPVPALKAIQDVEKRKNTEDDKTAKKAKIDDAALDLSARMREPPLHWMRPILANQFVPRST